jgi:Pyruvate/2-oxoacid:ferredoxin oxidoreductase delta subunit
MMKVDLGKCTGCGMCLDTCPVEAISMVGGKATIDADTCLSCSACALICPEQAISEISLAIPATMTSDIQPVRIHTARPVLSSPPESRLAWAVPALSYVGREILPRLIDSLVAAFDRRLSVSSKTQGTLNQATRRRTNGGRRQMHRRLRGNSSNREGR